MPAGHLSQLTPELLPELKYLDVKLNVTEFQYDDDDYDYDDNEW